MADDIKLNPSKLGTKEYWENFYNVEKGNFAENPDDTGECWFADSGAEERMAQFLQRVAEDNELPGIVEFDSTEFLDLGTGNGRLLFAMRDADFEGFLTGLDYSKEAAEFAALVAENEGVSDTKFLCADFLSSNEWNADNKTWPVVLDKGTLDAIALSSDTYGSRTAVEQYVHVVKDMVAAGGMLLITSCNFTEKELVSTVENKSDGALSLWKTIKYPSFKFGGAEGQTICSVAFLKKTIE